MGLNREEICAYEIVSMSPVIVLEGIADSPVIESLSELDIQHFYPSQLNRDQFHFLCCPSL